MKINILNFFREIEPALQNLIVHQAEGTKKGDATEAQYGPEIDAVLQSAAGSDPRAFAVQVLQAAVPKLEAQINADLAERNLPAIELEIVEQVVDGAIEQGAADLEQRLDSGQPPAPAAAPPATGGSPE